MAVMTDPIRMYALKAVDSELAQLQTKMTELHDIRRQLNPTDKRNIAATMIRADAPARTRPTMTAAQKKAVSERMKKYWAARKKTDKK